MIISGNRSCFLGMGEWDGKKVTDWIIHDHSKQIPKHRSYDYCKIVCLFLLYSFLLKKKHNSTTFLLRIIKFLPKQTQFDGLCRDPPSRTRSRRNTLRRATGGSKLWRPFEFQAEQATEIFFCDEKVSNAFGRSIWIVLAIDYHQQKYYITAIE